MKSLLRRLLLLSATVSFLVSLHARERLLWDVDWRFHLGDAVSASALAFDDTSWRRLDLPHDWSIELPINQAAPSTGHGGFFQNGIAWYRKTFRAPPSWESQAVILEFEGVSTNADVFVNGVSVARHPYGFTPFVVDLTPHLQLGTENVVAVRVDHSAQPIARFYTGSGIYRHVWLHVTSPVHVAHEGVYVVTKKATADEAMLDLEVVVANEDGTEQSLTAEIEVLGPNGRRVARTQRPIAVGPNANGRLAAPLRVSRPRLWSPTTPMLYRVVVRLRRGDTVLDESRTSFGIRTLSWSTERGLVLNGETIKLNGGNVHHDTGILGAAAFDRAEERKVELLKAEGFNAVRTAHNPPSRAFLEACDRLGVLVLDEIFDGWARAKTKHDYSEHFAEWWPRDVEAWVKRDRNHPSIVCWSIGNEMFERTSAEGVRIARELVQRIRSFDTTRPISAGVNGAGKNGRWEQLDPLFATLDIAGYNYELAAQHVRDHTRLPDRVIMATESYQSEVFENWAIVQQEPYVIGDFVWSALDYLGEAGIGRVFPPGDPALKHWEANMWPWHGAACGDIDLTGWRKPISHYRNIVWDRGEKLYVAVEVPAPGGQSWNVTPWSLSPMLPSWTWPGCEGTSLHVHVYSRFEVVRLFLNGRLIAEKTTTLADQFHATFSVPYAPGELKIQGLKKGRVAGTFMLNTADAPAALRLTVDRAKIRADAQDLAFVTVEAVDREGRWNPKATGNVEFSVTGAGTLAGVGTADFTAMESYVGNKCRLFQGRALVAIRSKWAGGKLVLHAFTDGLPEASCVMRAVK